MAYDTVIARYTALNPVHVETLMLADHRTLNGLPASIFEAYARRAERMGAEKLAAFHAAETFA